MVIEHSDYELGLMDFETYHTISNLNSLNNKFYFDEDDKKLSFSKDRTKYVTQTSI